ncbi:MAG: hypothetical protein ACUZ8H_04000 [Candidatus Anammoxibacter sp.]
MKTKHTGTKWEVTGQSDSGRYITVKSDTGRTVARIPWCTDKEGENGLASDHYDAELIAVAPELLKHLYDICESIQLQIDSGHGQIEPVVVESYNNALKVISKASPQG